MNKLLKNSLESFEMTSADALVKVGNMDSVDKNLPSEEIIAIEYALRFGADYIYFRRFENRPSIPQVYIYDFTDRIDVPEYELIELHKRLYSSGHVPMFFVFSKKDVVIFNCYEKQPFEGDRFVYKPLKVISLAANIQDTIDDFKAFSGKSFDNGTFWENSPYSKAFQFTHSSYERLLRELKQALNDVVKRRILPESIAKKLMVVSILIKYLEDRTDEHKNSVFPKAGEERIVIRNGRRKKEKFDSSFFAEFAKGANSFIDVLQVKGAALKLFEYLATHFNGGVFKLSKEEKAELKSVDLARFATFLQGNADGEQFQFWRLYSFNDLPIELVSNIYEEFIDKRPGVVYTPPFLVNLLLDETMPLSDTTSNFKVLDPSCGSGVFLVGAYRRLIYRWRIAKGWQKPSLKVLKEILTNNIYGADIDPEAIQLTIFSLSLALCDELSPLQIWSDLEFDNLLGTNLFDEDFFQLTLDNKLNQRFDLVIGNPPFESKLTAAAKKVNDLKSANRVLTYSINGKEKNEKVKLPDNQIALLFLEKSIDLCKPGKLVCLIEPSGPFLYNNRSLQYRKFLFKNYNVPQILDFTHLSRVLFKTGKGEETTGDVATAAIFIRNEPANEKGLLHITVRRTKPNKEKIYFELDSYDFHYVPRKLLNDALIWKSNLLIGNRAHQLLNRFKDERSFGAYLDEKEKNENWVIREGFKTGPKSEVDFLETMENRKIDTLSTEEKNKLNKLNIKYSKAPFLFNKDTLLSNGGLTEYGINEDKITKLKSKFFLADWIKRLEIFNPPHILIGEVAGLKSIPIDFSDKFLSFTAQTIGIHGNNKKELQEINTRFKENKLYLFYLAGISGRFMVNKSTSILKSDIDKLPYPLKQSELALNVYEQIIVDDVVDFMIDFKKQGENSLIAKENVSPSQLKEFGKLYCEVLNSVYKSFKPHKPFETDSYICYPFYFKEKPIIEFDNKEKAEKYIEKLVQKASGVSLRLTRIVRVYDNNVIFLIKPKKMRFWLRSIALRDADETFVDLRKQGF